MRLINSTRSKIFGILKLNLFWNKSYYGNGVRHLNVRIGEDKPISLFTKKQVGLKNSSVANDLVFLKHSASYDDMIFLTHENRKSLLKLKESLLIMRD